MYEVFVSGRPVSQGSMKAFRTGMKTVIVHNKQKELTEWRDKISKEIYAKYPEFKENIPFPQNTSVYMEMIFIFERPKSVSVKKRPYMCVKPDGDKCMRAVFDACTKVLYFDDSQVVCATFRKEYSKDGKEGMILRFDPFNSQSLSNDVQNNQPCPTYPTQP